MSSTPVAAALVALAFAAPLACAWAGDRGPIEQDLQISIGSFTTDFDTAVRLDGEAKDIGTTIDDWEGEFDYLGDRERFRVDAFWRFAERHKLRAMYFENNRSQSDVLTRDIKFGDTTFPVSLEVDTRLDVLIVELAYEYAFLKREDVELGGSFGIHNVRIKPSLHGTLSMPGGGDPTELAEASDVNGPLPVFGAHLLWHVGRNVYFEGIAQYFFLELGEYDGSLSDFKAGLTWFPWRHLGVGVGYNRSVTRLDVDDGEFLGRIRVRYSGPLVYVTVGF